MRSTTGESAPHWHVGAQHLSSRIVRVQRKVEKAIKDPLGRDFARVHAGADEDDWAVSKVEWPRLAFWEEALNWFFILRRVCYGSLQGSHSGGDGEEINSLALEGICEELALVINLTRAMRSVLLLQREQRL
jgi:hypothetical protein